MNDLETNVTAKTEETVVMALAKGRLMEDTLKLMKEKMNVALPEGIESTRKLQVEAPEAGLRFLIVRSQDVPTYVEHGAADIGVVGKDSLLEQGKSLYEPVDLKFGYCRVVVAAPKERQPGRRMYRVASKFPNIAERHFQSKGVPAEVIKLYGSIELAPVVGMADGIVDLVSSGRTLKENGLEIVDVIAECTARLVVNRASLKLKRETICRWIEDFRRAVE